MATFVISTDLKVHGDITDKNDVVVDGAPSAEVSKNSGAAVGVRRTLNFIEGTNITLAIVDDPGEDEIDITITAAAPTAGESVESTSMALVLS